jgi:arylsulfatase A-like enzyme
MTCPALTARAARAFAALALLALAAGCARDDRPPHIFVVSVDTLRADYLAPYGATLADTPTTAKLAAEGTLYTRAVTPMGITVPVHATLLTGLMPRQHGVRANVHRLADGIATLPERLDAAGYRSASVLSLGMMNFVSGLDRGFDHASDRAEDGRAFKRADEDTLELATEWITRQDGSQPLFMLLHFYDVHAPHLPTEFTPPMPPGYDGPLADGISIETLYNESQPLLDDPDDMAALRALYAGEAAASDDRTGRFLAALDEAGLLEDSIVIFLADHGQGLGENGYFGHGPTLEQTVLHVPLIIRDFRRPPDPGRITDTVGLIDVAPTVLAMAGVEGAGELPGRDLLTVDDGDDPVAYLSEVEQRSSQTEFRPAYFDEEALAVYFDDYKLVEIDGEQRLFRIDATWGQDIEPAAMDAIHESLKVWLVEHMQAYRDGLSASERADLDDEAIEALRSLGYIQ